MQLLFFLNQRWHTLPDWKSSESSATLGEVDFESLSIWRLSLRVTQLRFHNLPHQMYAFVTSNPMFMVTPCKVKVFWIQRECSFRFCVFKSYMSHIFLHVAPVDYLKSSNPLHNDDRVPDISRIPLNKLRFFCKTKIPFLLGSNGIYFRVTIWWWVSGGFAYLSPAISQVAGLYGSVREVGYKYNFVRRLSVFFVFFCCFILFTPVFSVAIQGG